MLRDRAVLLAPVLPRIEDAFAGTPGVATLTPAAAALATRFSAFGPGNDAGSDVDSHPADIAVSTLAFAAVEAGAYLDPERLPAARVLALEGLVGPAVVVVDGGRVAAVEPVDGVQVQDGGIVGCGVDPAAVLVDGVPRVEGGVPRWGREGWPIETG